MNEQEAFWRGPFGDEYTRRNKYDWRTRSAFWREVLRLTGARSILEVGCNRGLNLLALRDEDASLKLRGVDLNADALTEACKQYLDAREVGASEVGVLWPRQFDLAFTAGVLIHISPTHLQSAMQSIAKASREWVLAVEYESDEESEVVYRGHSERLWKRPFGRIYQDMGLKLETSFPAEGFDRCTAWLLRK